MENTGYIKLYRQVMSSEIWYKPPEWFKIWNYVLMNVNFRQNGLPIGSGRFSYKQIEDDCTVTHSTIDHFLRWAKSNEMITTKQQNRLVIISVINFAEYQEQGDGLTNVKRGLTQKKTEKHEKSAMIEATVEATEYIALDIDYTDTEATVEATVEANRQRTIGDSSANLYKKKKELRSNNINTDLENELKQLIDNFNSLDSKYNFPKTRKATDDLVKVYTKLRKKYEGNEIGQGLNNYLDFLDDKKNAFYTHRFSLYEFLKQGNGFEKYFNR